MKRNIIASLLIFFSAFFLYSSCAKIDTTSIGSGLIPVVDNINTFDTVLEVITDNKLFDDTTRMLYTSFHALGIIENDAEFGKTTAAIYASFTPVTYKAYPFIKKDTVIVDSVVLSLAYVRSYGDSNSIEQFDVREMDVHSGFTDSLYFLNSPDFQVNANLLGSSVVDFHKLKDSVVYKNAKDTIRTFSELRIHLDTSFARRFINYDTTNVYNNDSAFKTAFKGLEIRPNEGSPSKNGLAYFNLDDNARTRITFYCRVQNNGKTDTIAPQFNYTNDPHANLIRRTPGNEYLSNINNGNPNDEKLYIQSAPGSYALLTIPGLSQLSNRVIHRAELIFDKYPSVEDFYAPPGFLFVEALNAAGDTAFTIRNDFVPVGSNAVGYDLNSLGGNLHRNQYILLLTRYIQSIVTKGYSNPKLRVYAPYTTRPYYIQQNTDTYDPSPANRPRIVLNAPVATGRVVLYGGGTAEPKKARLRIIYSKI